MVAIGMAAPVALDAAEEAAPPAALVALARCEDAELASEEAEACADEPPVAAADVADATSDERELATEEADALAAEAAEDAWLEALAPAEACDKLALKGRFELRSVFSLLIRLLR
jgi:hypothetical protein